MGRNRSKLPSQPGAPDSPELCCYVVIVKEKRECVNQNFRISLSTEIQKLIAKRIRGFRKRRKISQQKLISLSGVILGSVKRFEQSGEISLPSLIKIAIALDLEKELEQLFANVPPLSIEEIIHGSD